MYEFSRIVHGKVKQLSDYFLFLCNAKNGQYFFSEVEKLFENPAYFSKPSKLDHHHHSMLQKLGKIISRCGYSAEAWFQSVSLDNEKIFFNEFSASVLLLSVQCRAPLEREPFVKELFAFIINSPEQLYFTRHDFAFAFRRMRMNADEMNKLNQSAGMLAELFTFLLDRHLTLRDFRLRMVQQQVDQANHSNPTKLYQITHHGSSAGHHTHTNNQHNHHHQHHNHQHHNHQHHNHHHHHGHHRRHYYDDPSVAVAMETLGIGDCEALFTTVFNYHGKKTGAMPSLSTASGRWDWQLPSFSGLNTASMVESPHRSHHVFSEQQEIANEQRPRTSPTISQSSNRSTMGIKIPHRLMMGSESQPRPFTSPNNTSKRI
jgi:hypothetical protein